jgi:hypothetical protein
MLVFLSFFAASLGLGFATGIVEPDKWHQNHAVYHQQADAFLQGRFAIGNDPSRLKMDMAWHDGGVQQIWGLGVPLLLLPGHTLAKLVGGFAFPDRALFLLLLAGLGAATHATLRTVCGHWLGAIAGVATMCFPPFVSLLLSRFQIWEEAVAYEYLAVGYLLVAVVALAIRPSGPRFVVIWALAGFVPFVRPTALVYSIVAALLSLLLYERRTVNRAKALGAAIAIVFAGLFLLTNAIRFGAPLELGHSIHTNLYTLIDYTTTFENPFRQATLPSAAKDFFGSFVFTNIPAWKGFYATGLFAWQSPTFRWHEFYFRAYDASYLVLLLASWTILAWLLWRRRSTGPFEPVTRVVVALQLWSLLAFAGLFLFYLKFFGLSSRFLLDFAPAIVAALVGTMIFLLRLPRARRLGFGLALVVAGWFAAQLWLGSRPNTRIATGTAKVVSKQTMRETLGRLDQPSSIPARYVVSEDPRATNIPFNGTGWDHGSGDTAPYAVFFIKDPQFVRLVFDTAVIRAKPAYEAVAVKVGLEYLPRIRETTDGRYLTLEFAAPKRPAYQKGIQMLSLRTTTAQALQNLPETGLALMEVNWNPAVP